MTAFAKILKFLPAFKGILDMEEFHRLLSPRTKQPGSCLWLRLACNCCTVLIPLTDHLLDEPIPRQDGGLRPHLKHAGLHQPRHFDATHFSMC